MKIKKNLYYVSGGLYGHLGNVFAIKHSEGYILIDTGKPDAYDKIIENLHYWGIDENAITHVLLTHGHDDHAGCAKFFQSIGAKIVVGKADDEMLQQGNFGTESPFQNHQMPSCKGDILIDKDTTMNVGNLEVHIYTMPGHTKGNLLYYLALDEDYLLFSGDMFFSDGEKGDQAFIGWKGDLNYNSEKLGNSFKKLWDLNLSPTIVLGGHGNPRIGKEAKDTIMLAYKCYLLNCR